MLRKVLKAVLLRNSMRHLNNLSRKYYDLLVGAPRDFEKQVTFIDKLFKKHNVKTVLDCGCGTGTHAILLAKKGYSVTAFDYSKEQVKLAGKKANQSNVKIRFRTGDIRDFDFGKFDAVISLFSPIMFACKNQRELTQALRSIKKSLNPGGVALVETMTTKMRERSGLEINKYSSKELKASRLAFYTFQRKGAKVKYVYVIQKKGKTTCQEADANHYYYDKADLVKAFKKINAKVIKWHSNFDKNKGTYAPFTEGKSWMVTPIFQ